MNTNQSKQVGIILTAATTVPEKSELSIKYLGKWSFEDRYRSIEQYPILPYHWDNRKELLKDYNFLGTINNEAITLIGKHLNRIHGTEHSSKFWRIVLGPWIIAFVPAVLDRFKSIQGALNDSPDETVFLTSHHLRTDEAPNEMSCFLSDLNNHSWNERLYLQIANELKATILVSGISPITESDAATQKSATYKEKINPLKTFLYRGIRRNKHAFSTTYISPMILRRLQISLKQIPLTLPQIPVPNFETDFSIRQSNVWQLEFDRINVPHEYKKFITILEKIIPKYLPKSYLEGFKFIQQLPIIHSWPQSVETIFTATGIYNDEIFKIWAAQESENGARLILAQHGGCYGTSLFHSREDHELSVSDKYLTWGWEKGGYSQISPIGNLTHVKKSIKSNIQGKALVGLTQGNEYTSFLESTPLSAGQWQMYQERQLEFVGKFPPDFSSNLQIRLYPSKPNNELRKVWSEKFPNVTLDEVGKSFNKSLSQARIYVGTDNNTTWLNTLNSNFPTMIVFDAKYWEFRPEAEPYFSLLEKAGIFHSSSASAAEHLQAIWSHLEAWWKSPQVQESRVQFINKFSAHNSSLYKSIRNEIVK